MLPSVQTRRSVRAGTLLRAEIAQGDDEAVVLCFDEAGKRLPC